MVLRSFRLVGTMLAHPPYVSRVRREFWLDDPPATLENEKVPNQSHAGDTLCKASPYKGDYAFISPYQQRNSSRYVFDGDLRARRREHRGFFQQEKSVLRRMHIEKE